MSIWNASPAREGTIPNYHILRTPTTQGIRAVCIGDRHEGVKLHFWKGRSRPCPGDDCPACMEGHVPRWKGYVLVKSVDNPKIVIFEFTERAHHAFHDRFLRYGSLRGCIFLARRTNRKINGPLVVEFEDARMDEALLPGDCDLRAMLERIWEIRQQGLPFQGNGKDTLALYGEEQRA